MHRQNLVLVAAGIILLSGCQTSRKNPGSGELGPELSLSTQIQRKFFVCKDLVGGDWIGVSETFSTLDQQIILVARLDRDSLYSRLTMQIVSPENKIIEVENRDYRQLRDVGVVFNPERLIEKGGGAGRFRGRFLVDSTLVGEVPFIVEDRREINIEAMDPVLQEIEWDPEVFQ